MDGLRGRAGGQGRLISFIEGTEGLLEYWNRQIKEKRTGIHTHTHTHIYIHIYIHTYQPYIYICLYIYIYIYIYIYGSNNERAHVMWLSHW